MTSFTFKGTWEKTKKWSLVHKIWSGVILLVVIAGLWWGYQALTPTATGTTYVLGTTTEGTVVASVSESGQVAASSEIEIKPQASGQITWVGIKPGDEVSAGQALVSINDTTALQSLADAESTLQQDELQYQQDSAQAPIDYQNAVTAVGNASTTLANDYVNTFNTFSNAYQDLPTAVSGAQDILYGYDLSPTSAQWNVDILTNMFQNNDRLAIEPFATQAETNFNAANTEYEAALLAYQQLDRSASTTAVDALLQKSINTTTDVAQAIQSELNFLGEVNTIATIDNRKLPSLVNTMQTNGRNYLTTVNNDLNSLLAEQKTLSNDKQAIVTAEQNLTLLQTGNNASDTDPLSLQETKSSLNKEEQDIANEKQALSDYTVVAPFSGTIAAVTATVGDQTGSTVATIVTNDQLATVSVNEVDAAKLKLGDQATLTFDAIPNLTLTGSVVELDPVGTVTSGVVSYNVEIDFVTQNPQVKPGMTVNAAIQTDVEQNVLLVPSTAIKAMNGASYVQVFTPPLANTGGTQGVMTSETPMLVPVQTGISDDTNTEITSGLTQGEQIIVKTNTTGLNTTTSAAAAATTRGGAGGFGGGGLGGRGGAGVVLP